MYNLYTYVIEILYTVEMVPSLLGDRVNLEI